MSNMAISLKIVILFPDRATVKYILFSLKFKVFNVPSIARTCSIVPLKQEIKLWVNIIRCNF